MKAMAKYTFLMTSFGRLLMGLGAGLPKNFVT